MYRLSYVRSARVRFVRVLDHGEVGTVLATG